MELRASGAVFHQTRATEKGALPDENIYIYFVAVGFAAVFCHRALNLRPPPPVAHSWFCVIVLAGFFALVAPACPRQGCYKGFSSMILKEGLGNSVYFGSYELCKQVN